MFIEKLRGKVDKNVRQTSTTMGSLSVFADERKDIITAVSTPTKGSRRLATASMTFEKLNSPKKKNSREENLSTSASNLNELCGSPKDDLKAIKIRDNLTKSITVSVARPPCATGSRGLGLLLCTNELGYQIIGINSKSASKNLMVRNLGGPLVRTRRAYLLCQSPPWLYKMLQVACSGQNECVNRISFGTFFGSQLPQRE